MAGLQILGEVETLGWLGGLWGDGRLTVTKSYFGDDDNKFRVVEYVENRKGNLRQAQEYLLEDVQDVRLRGSWVGRGAIILALLSIPLSILLWNPCVALGAWSLTCIARRHRTVVVMTTNKSVVRRTARDRRAREFQLAFERAVYESWQRDRHRNVIGVSPCMN